MPAHLLKPSIACAALIAVTMLVACSPREETAEQTNENTATATPAHHEDVYRFTIGELSAVALRDGSFTFPNDNKIFGAGRTPDEVAAVLSQAGLPESEVHLSIQPLLVEAPDRVLLFDTGAGATMGSDTGRLPASLAVAGIDPATVSDIFISHSHGDHVNGLVNAEGAPAFPNAVIHISAPEWEFLKSLDATTAAEQNGITAYDALIAAVSPKVDAFTAGAELIPGLVQAVDIKGHTPGHSAYRISSAGSSLLYVGDSMHHFVLSVARPQWTVTFDRDTATAASSRSDLLARSAESGQRLYAVHFPFPGLGRIERRPEGEPGFVWVAESSGGMHAAHR
ncbi:MAG TPA: MBL fold metallo-hydrolase [Steroidobacter sp.]